MKISLISAGRPRNRAASGLDHVQALGSLKHMNVQGDFCSKRNSLFFVCQETAMASNKIANKCANISIREDVFASGFS